MAPERNAVRAVVVQYIIGLDIAMSAVIQPHLAWHVHGVLCVTCEGFNPKTETTLTSRGT